MKMYTLAALLSLALCGATCRAETGQESLVVSFHAACPGAEKPEGLGTVFGALGKVIVGGVVDWVGVMATAQGEDKRAIVGAGFGNDRFFSLDAQGAVKRTLGCLSVLRPGRGKEQPDAGADAALVNERVRSLFNVPADRVTAPPDFYASFEIISVPAYPEVFALRIVDLYQGRSAISGWGSRERGLALAINFFAQGQPDKPFASTIFSFADVDLGKLRSREQEYMFRSSSGWLAAPPRTDAEKVLLADAEERARELLAYREAEKRQFKDTAYTAGSVPPAPVLPRSFGYVTAAVTVTETRAGSPLWASIGKALSDRKTELNKAITETVIPSERRAAAAAEEEADETNRNQMDTASIAYVEAQLAVVRKREALKALASNASDVDKEEANTALIVAQLNANIAARKAKVVPLPYPDLSRR